MRAARRRCSAGVRASGSTTGSRARSRGTARFSAREAAAREEPHGMSERAEALRKQILDLVTEYAAVAHAPVPFVPGQSKVPYAGRVFDDREIRSLVSSSLDFWLTAGPYADRFERAMRKFFGAVDFLVVNS